MFFYLNIKNMFFNMYLFVIVQTEIISCLKKNEISTYWFIIYMYLLDKHG